MKILEIKIMDIIAIQYAAHLGIEKMSRILPIRVQRAIAIIIDAKKRISISFRLQKINIEIISAAIDSQLVVFKLYD